MIHHGDCLDVMAAMEPESVDAIVTDPPYGLEFMGKEWDRLDWRDGGGFSKPGLGDRPTAWTSFGGETANPTCATCGGRARGARKCGCETPDWRVKGAPMVDRAADRARKMQEWHARWAKAAYRVAKPSAYLLAFGGTRTVHRMTVALEDAGWIIRDMLVWGYASGFPKSKASLKPAWEPIVMARKPGPLRELAIDACRITYVSDTDREQARTVQGVSEASASKTAIYGSGKGIRQEPTQFAQSPLGRWPANIILTDPTLGSDYSRFFEIPGGTSCDWCGAPIAKPSLSPSSQPVGSAQSRAVTGIVGPTGYIEPPTGSPSTSGIEQTSWSDGDGTTPLTLRSKPPGTSPESERPSSPARSQDAASRGIAITTTTGVRWTCGTCAAAITSATTSPSPESREYPWAFLIPKADRSDREPVLGGLPEREAFVTGGPPVQKYCDVCGDSWITSAGIPRCGHGREHTKLRPTKNVPRQNVHPTVKPTDLMRHLIRLVTPSGGVVLDPFLGSGTTGLAAEMEGFAWIGIEREAEYVAIAEARLNGTQKGLGLDVGAPIPKMPNTHPDLSKHQPKQRAPGDNYSGRWSGTPPDEEPAA